MKSPSTYSRNTGKGRHNAPQNGGFTLIEVLIVIGIFGIIAAIGLVFSLDSYRSYLFRAEYGNMSHIIAKARNYSVNNFDGVAHGVHIDADSYTLFTGSSYNPGDPDNLTFDRSPVVDIDGATDIVFKQLSGDLDTTASNCDDLSGPTPTCTITFSYGVNTEEVVINEIGGITW